MALLPRTQPPAGVSPAPERARKPVARLLFNLCPNKFPIFLDLHKRVRTLERLRISGPASLRGFPSSSPSCGPVLVQEWCCLSLFRSGYFSPEDTHPTLPLLALLPGGPWLTAVSGTCHSGGGLGPVRSAAPQDHAVGKPRVDAPIGAWCCRVWCARSSASAFSSLLGGRRCSLALLSGFLLNEPFF